MPQEITDVEAFIQISDRANYCDIKRVSNVVKLKLRTSRRLYTLKVTPDKAEEIIKKLHCEIREV
ncbi:MAG: 50S ribosomal protein L38e [Candidatus Bathyarchaeota archaeon]|nr:MAG: 50S ribosomal protein L38e [Candidatus Bathyarchaeota archaeon]